jgi:hypothetical protein
MSPYTFQAVNATQLNILRKRVKVLGVDTIHDRAAGGIGPANSIAGTILALTTASGIAAWSHLPSTLFRGTIVTAMNTRSRLVISGADRNWRWRPTGNRVAWAWKNIPFTALRFCMIRTLDSRKRGVCTKANGKRWRCATAGCIAERGARKNVPFALFRRIIKLADHTRNCGNDPWTNCSWWWRTTACGIALNSLTARK